MSDFYIKKGDRLPLLRAELSDVNGAVNLSGTNVQFIYRNRTRVGNPVTGSANIVSHVSGVVEYVWGTGDVSAAGAYICEWRVTYTGNSKVLSFPNDSYLSFDIVDNLS